MHYYCEGILALDFEDVFSMPAVQFSDLANYKLCLSSAAKERPWQMQGGGMAREGRKGKGRGTGQRQGIMWKQ